MFGATALTPGVFVMIDGLTPELAESMDSLSNLNLSNVEPLLGYSPTCHASILTGLPPCDHGLWFLWGFDTRPRHSLLEVLSYLPFGASTPVRLALLGIFSRGRMNLRIPVHTSRPSLVCLRYINPPVWSALRLGSHPTIMGKAASMGYNIESRGIGQTEPGREADSVRDFALGPAKTLYVFSFGEVDSALHRYGGDSSEVTSAVRVVDQVIGNALSRIQSEVGTTPPVVVASDHGHVQVRKKVDIIDYFRRHGHSLSSVPHIIDTTFARFGATDEGMRQQIIDILESTGYGFVLEPKDFEKYRVPMDPIFGDVIFVLTEPWVFSKTVWGYSWMRSMHGYPPDVIPHDGVVASSTPLRGGRIQLTDVNHIACSTLLTGVD